MRESYREADASRLRALRAWTVPAKPSRGPHGVSRSCPVIGPGAGHHVRRREETTAGILPRTGRALPAHRDRFAHLRRTKLIGGHRIPSSVLVAHPVVA